MTMRTFRYSLQSLADLRAWRLEAAQQAVANANGNVRQLRDEQAALQAQMSSLAPFRDEEKHTMTAHDYSLAARFAASLAMRAHNLMQLMQVAIAEQERCCKVLETAMRDHDALKEHRRQEHEAARCEQERTASHEADALWLARFASGRTHAA